MEVICMDEWAEAEVAAAKAVGIMLAEQLIYNAAENDYPATAGYAACRLAEEYLNDPSWLDAVALAMQQHLAKS